MLKLYPASLTKAQFEAGDAALCNLPYALKPDVSQAINGDWSLTFGYPADKEDRLALDMLVEADGQLYRIEEISKNSAHEGERLEVRALHLMYDLRNRMIVNIETAETTPGGINQRTALQQALNGTDFEDGAIDTDILLDYLDILQKDVMWAIKEQVLGLWGGELAPDNWVIDIKKQMGRDRGAQLRYGKNIRGVKLSESLDGVITRLHIVGYQGANIESINDGKDYIDSPNISLYSGVREGMVTFPDDDLPEDLLSKGQAYLATVDTPRIKLSVDLAQVMTSVQYQHYKALEDVQLGDTVTVYHKRLGINITARVQKREYDPATGQNSKVELGNDDRSLYSEIASMQQAAEIIKMIADRKGHVRGEKLRGVVDLLTTQLMASGSYTNAQVIDDKGILFENTNVASVDYGAMYIGPGIFAIASTKTPEGSWDWRTFGTGRGFVGSEIVANSITANKLASDVGQSLDLSSNTAITAIVEEVNDPGTGLGALGLKLEDVETQLDGKIETFNQTGDPSTEWTTAPLKTAHTGDLWYHPTTKETKRWSGAGWVKLYNDEAAAAQALAENKRRVFVAQPIPPYDVGDLWAQGESGDLMRCKTAKATGSYSAANWEKASKYTDNTYASTKYDQTNAAFRWMMGYGPAANLDINNAQSYLGLNASGLKFIGANVDISANESLALKVGKSEVVASINATPEEVKIQAEKIDLVGKVTANDIQSDAIETGHISAGARQALLLDAQTEISAAVGGIQVGGSNLLLNSDFSQGAEVNWQAGGGLSTSQMFHGKSSLQLTSGTSATYKAQTVSNKVAPGETVTLSINVLTPYSSQYFANNGKTIALLRFSKSDTTPITQESITLPSGFTSNWQRLSLSKTAPAETGMVVVRLYSNDNAGVSSYLHFAEIKLEQGNKATPWSPAPEDPASGVMTAYMKMLADLFEVYTGGSINMLAGANFNVRAGTGKSGIGISNNQANNFFQWAGSDDPAIAPYSVTMDGALKATNLDGSFLLGVENGGTGRTRENILRGNSAPASNLGQDGDLYVLFNGTVGVSWNDTNLSYYGSGMATRAGAYRNWNDQSSEGNHFRIGNGIGSASYKFGAAAYFTCPAATKTLSFRMTTTKSVGGQYLSSGTTSYRVCLVDTVSGNIVGETTVDASSNDVVRDVIISSGSTLVSGRTYYVAVFYHDLTEKTGAAIVGAIVLKAAASQTTGSALYIKTNGAWVRLAGA